MPNAIQLPDLDETHRPAKAGYLRIATEEAFAPPDLLAIYRRLLKRRDVNPGFRSLIGFFMSSASDYTQHILRCLTDVDEIRLEHMDRAGIDIQVLSLAAPGVQVMESAEAVAFAGAANDYLADAIRRHPTRFAGTIAVAPQNPAAAAKEIARGVSQLGLHAVLINSHTGGEYLSDSKFWDIFAAAEEHRVPVFLHPTSLPPGMFQPFYECGLDGPIYGQGVEAGLHALRLITAGVFDHFPKLRVVIGHLGEALPFQAYRLDYTHRATVQSKRYDSVRPIRKRPSDYLRENFYVTSSGVVWEPAIKFAQDFMGVDRVLYAMDYPYEYAVDEVCMLDAMDMPTEDKRRFFQTNAQSLFRINNR